MPANGRSPIANDNWSFNEQFLPGTIVYDGKVYDHIRFRNRGETTTYMTGKNKWRFNFNRGHEIEPPVDYRHTMEKPWRRLNLNPGTIPYNPAFRGNAGLQERIGYRVHQLAGLPACDTCYLQLRVIDDADENGRTQYDGDLWGLYMGFEAIDGRYLDNHGLPEGELFKIAQSGVIQKRESVTGVSKGSDFRSFWNALRQRRQSGAWWKREINVPHYASYHAVSIAIARHDQKLNHNYSLFHHPTEGWMPLPWDLDQCLWPTQYQPNGFRWQTYLKYSMADSEIRLDYQNRARELLDLLFQEEQIHALVDELAAPLGDIEGRNFPELDALLWNNHPQATRGHRGTFFQNPIYPRHESVPHSIR